MKLPPGKYCLEDCLETFSPMKISTVNIAPQENPHKKIPPVRIALLQIKKQNIFKI